MISKPVQPALPEINLSQTELQLVNFIRNQIQAAGYTRVVLGLSGGIDSALVCFLSAKAAGPENVLAIRMPYRTSSADSLSHAQLVIDQTGVLAQTTPVTTMVEALLKQYPDMTPLRKGNVMARARMIILYDQSASFRGLVAGTGNKTEALLGYTTLYGDSACAFNPVGNLYKTYVLQLARFMGVPQEIINKPPSADLWAGQTDEDEIGFTYAEMDRLLYQMIDLQRSPEECAAAGFAEQMITTITARINANQFKRQNPPVAEIR